MWPIMMAKNVVLYLRTFALKSSKNDFLIKILLQLDNELLVVEMQKKW